MVTKACKEPFNCYRHSKYIRPTCTVTLFMYCFKLILLSVDFSSNLLFLCVGFTEHCFIESHGRSIEAIRY
jgi:hypothetical protein